MEFMSRAIELAGIYFTTGVRWFFLILSIFILARQIRSLLQARNPSEIWAYLGCPDDTTVPLTHWENLIGRSRGCDVILNLNSVSRSHGTLIRDSDGVWKYNDLNSKNGSAINGVPVKEPTILKAGDVLTIGGSDFTLYPVSLEERMANIEKRKKRTHPVSPWPSLVALTLFQFLMCVQFKVALGEDFPPQLPFAVGLLCILMWTYVIIMRFFKRVGFEMEIIAFYLSTLSVNGIETVDLYLPGCRPVLRAVLVPERSEPGETDRIYNDGDQRASADHQPGVRHNEIRCIQLGQHRRDEHPAVRTGQNRVHLRWRRHAGRAAAAKKSVDIHGLLRLLSGLSCTHGRLRNSTDLLCHIPGHLLPSER